MANLVGRMNVEISATIKDASMKDDHRGPVDGRCFLGLNFSEEQFSKINPSIVDHMHDKSGEFAVEDAIFELIEKGMRSGVN